MRRTDSTATLAAGAVLALATGCGRPPNPALEQARVAYRQVAAAPDVVASAPVEVDEVARALQRTERAYEDGKSDDDVNSLAYVTERRVDIARMAAQQKKAEAETDRLNSRRSDMLVGDGADTRTVELEEELASLRPQETERGLVVTLSDARFEADRPTLEPGAMRALDQVAEALGKDGDRRVLVEGHTADVSGEDEKELSQARADAVKSYLVGRGVAPDRIVAHGDGETDPAGANGDSEDRGRKRRVDVVLLAPGER